MTAYCSRRMLVAAAVALTVWLPEPGTAQARMTRPTLAFMNFTNAALTNRADYEPLEWAVPEALTSRLGRNAAIDVVDRQRLQALLDEQNLGSTGRVETESAQRVGRLLGAQYMIFGSVLIDRRNRLRIDARVLEVETSKLVHSETFRDGDWNEDVSAVIDTIAERLNRNLKLPGRLVLTAPPVDSIATTASPTTETARPVPAVAGSGNRSTLVTTVNAPPAAKATVKTVATSSAQPTSGKNNGFLMYGRALKMIRGAKTATPDQVVMLRAAAQESPGFSREINDLIRKLSMSGGQ